MVSSSHHYDYQIKAHHWVMTLIAALILHLLLVIGFKQESNLALDNRNSNNELVINLKKITLPAAPKLNPIQPPAIQERPVINKPKVKEPLQQPPIKKVIPIKPIAKKKPIVKPVIEPISIATPNPSKSAIKHERDQSTVKSSIQANDHVSSTKSARYLNEKSRYLTELQLWLAKHKRYPTIARRRNLEGTVIVRFSIDRDGNLLTHEVVQPSEHRSLNKAAEKMLMSASPLPKVPLNLINNQTRFEYTIPVNFSLVSK